MRMKFIEQAENYKKYLLGHYTLTISDNGKDFSIYSGDTPAYFPDIVYKYGALHIQQNMVFATAEHAEMLIESYQEAVEVIKFIEKRFLK